MSDTMFIGNYPMFKLSQFKIYAITYFSIAKGGSKYIVKKGMYINNHLLLLNLPDLQLKTRR